MTPGVYNFMKMLSGLHGAAASFQWVMDKALKGVRDCAVAYIDDIFVFSPTWAQHLEHLRQVFQPLYQAGLMANHNKSHLGNDTSAIPQTSNRPGVHLGHSQLNLNLI